MTSANFLKYKNADHQKVSYSILMQTIIQTQENERCRIATDLHDSIGQRISAAKFLISSLCHEQIDDASKEMLIKANDILQDLIVELRNICHELLPVSLQESGIESAIKDIVEAIRINNQISVKLDLRIENQMIPLSCQMDIFRITQELLANSLKHGHPDAIFISLKFINHSLRFVYEDNGIGFDPSQNHEGFGLKNIRIRIESRKGKLKIVSNQLNKTRTTITMPL
ncbi:MAG: sensor histidine kinase [Niabella sp.]